MAKKGCDRPTRRGCGSVERVGVVTPLVSGCGFLLSTWLSSTSERLWRAGVWSSPAWTVSARRMLSWRSILELALESARVLMCRSGILKVKVLPSPMVDRTLIAPCIRLASCEQIERPRPVPPYFLLRPRSACTNGSKIFPSMLCSIPGPESDTSNSKLR